jgi:hypothetical protein
MVIIIYEADRLNNYIFILKLMESIKYLIHKSDAELIKSCSLGEEDY